MKKQPDSKKMEDLLRSAANQTGIDPDVIRQAIQQGNGQDLLNRLPPQEAERLRPFLNDPNAAAKIIATPQAQALLKKWFGDDNS